VADLLRLTDAQPVDAVRRVPAASDDGSGA
jgi:hypothetical protein